MFKNTTPTLLLLCCFFITIHAKAQQKITLLNGKEITVNSYSVGEMFVNYKLDGDGPKKLRLVDKYDVFSVTGPDSKIGRAHV